VPVLRVCARAVPPVVLPDRTADPMGRMLMLKRGPTVPKKKQQKAKRGSTAFTGQPAGCSRYTAVTLNKPLDFERGGQFFRAIVLHALTIGSIGTTGVRGMCSGRGGGHGG
jgi:hypothetical protein